MIYIAGDHAGFSLKELLVQKLKEEGYNLKDLGAGGYNPDDDYPEFAKKVAKEVQGTNDLGILVCASGTGMAITANKFSRVRAFVAWNKGIANLGRSHNHGNLLCLPARFIEIEEARGIVEVWLETEKSSKERHLRRINQVTQIERDQILK